MSENKINQLENPSEMPGNFIHDFIDEDLAEGGQYEGRTVHTRFPPEPNGYLHIGHAKAIYIDFATAAKYNGICNLRMDDTNPIREDVEYVDAIIEDVHWLGYDWDDRFYFASDYFEDMYQYAVELIEKGLAFVCELTPDQIRETRGTLTEPGTNSPYRDRSIAENLDLFKRMRAGEFENGKMTLRAKIDMSAGNMNMRDPVIYRIAHETHHRTGDTWCIYPMYDFAHPIEDAIEGITHSLCSLEFEDHRPLYNWFVENCSVPYKPRQIEFSRLNIENTVLSKRKLRTLVEENIVNGWDDPRMPTIGGLRRRGYTAQSIRNFCERVGISKVDSMVSHDFLEFCLREDLNDHALRGSAVLDPIKLIITNYPEEQKESVEVQNFPYKPELGSHEMTFSKEIWIEKNDYAIDPPKKYHRLYEGNEVRLRGAYIVKCTGHITDDSGNIVAVTAEYDPESKCGKATDGRKIRGTIHWVGTEDAVDSEIRIYENLFSVADPGSSDQDYHELINPESLTIIQNAKIEPWILNEENKGKAFQFMRQGYFIEDNKDSTPDKPVFNRAVSLRETYKPNK